MTLQQARETEYWIQRREQLDLLTSGVRQEILDTVEASGPYSIREIAEELGRPADGLYYHVEMLVEVGLLVEVEEESAGGRGARYDISASSLAIAPTPPDPETAALVVKIREAMTRLAARDFREGLAEDLAVTEGDARNVWASRAKAWLTREELVRANRHLRRLDELFAGAKKRSDTSLVVLTWILSPVRARPARRLGSGSSLDVPQARHALVADQGLGGRPGEDG